MSDQKISTLLALSLLASPITLPAGTSSYNNTKTASSTISSEATSSSQRISARRMKHQLAATSVLQPMGTYVGELQEKWQFPSDHLPIGMTFDNLNIVSWNVLDAEYMSWVTEKNSQGLSRSMIADGHVYIEDSKLTIRDKHVVDLVLQTIRHPTHPRSILALQECSQPFIEELRSRFPSHFEIISNGDKSLLLDRRLFAVASAKVSSGIFTNEPDTTVQDVTVRRLDNGQLLRLVNAHLPGDPTKPARFEFAQYLAKTLDPALATISMGDMNFNELEMSDAMRQAFPSSSPFSLYSPYCTNISPIVFHSKAIDHFLVYSPDRSSVVLSRPNEIMPKLGATAALLQKSDYLHPLLANHIDAPLPLEAASDQVLGVYGNILYPQDKEQIQQKKLIDWIEEGVAKLLKNKMIFLKDGKGGFRSFAIPSEAYSKDSSVPFPLSPEDLNDISLYILDRFPLGTIRHYFAEQVHKSLANGQPLESALEHAKQETLIRAQLYKKIAQNIPAWKGRCEILIAKLVECADQVDQIVDCDVKVIRNNPDVALQQMLKKTATDLIKPPFTWDMRTQVFKQMIDKVTSVSPNSPYFLALQEVTPQALVDLKKTFADRDLQWISFNNMSGKETLAPQQEEILGEATGFTSTLALSRDLEILKVELGDLPTESGSIRKILGVRVRNTHTNETFNLFTTHTDHKIQNDIYARTAAKIHEFATRFFQDAPTEQRFVIGGDLNVFDQSGGGKYIERLRELFAGSQDFRETDYYAPNPIAWSSFIGRYDDTYSGRIAKDGIVEPSALDHVIVGNGVELQSAAREAAVCNDSGELLDYYKERDEYMANLQNRMTFSDHFFNIVRFK